MTLKQNLVKHIAAIVDKRPTRLDKITWQDIIDKAEQGYPSLKPQLNLSHSLSESQLITTLAMYQEFLDTHKGSSILLTHLDCVGPGMYNHVVYTVGTTSHDIYQFLMANPQYRQAGFTLMLQPPQQLII